MSTLSSNTLVMCIQAVQAEIGRLRQAVEGEVDQLGPDDQALLLAYAKAAWELKQLHVAARETEPGLPPYDDLLPAP